MEVSALVARSARPRGQEQNADVTVEIARERRFKNRAGSTVALDVLFFVWLVVEGAFLVPWMVSRYGI